MSSHLADQNAFFPVIQGMLFDGENRQKLPPLL